MSDLPLLKITLEFDYQPNEEDYPAGTSIDEIMAIEKYTIWSEGSLDYIRSIDLEEPVIKIEKVGDEQNG